MPARPFAAATDAELLNRVAAMDAALSPAPPIDTAALAAAVVIAERPPSGCHWCGIAQRDHYSRYAEPTGWHRYTVPSQERVKARMLARRRHALTRRAVS
jgi:hypothetical protein